VGAGGECKRGTTAQTGEDALMPYVVVAGEGQKLGKATLDLEEGVEMLKKNGWREQGGVSIAVTQHQHGGVVSFHLVQAMVKDGRP
jgi:hypothetical protein